MASSADGTGSIIGGTRRLNGRIMNGTVISLNDDTGLEDIWDHEDDGMALDMVTDMDGEGDEEVSSFRSPTFSCACPCCDYRIAHGLIVVATHVFLTRTAYTYLFLLIPLSRAYTHLPIPFFRFVTMN
jgi:hypothetical protein